VSPRRFWIAAAATVSAAIAMRVPFRSHYLHSWDSANYALAMERIDIATHRPHPPGYVGYVMAARGLDAFLRDPNAALVCWNSSPRASSRFSS